MNLVLTAVLIGQLTTTSYRSVKEQCDPTPYHTSTGERVCQDGVAVSQDLLRSGKVKYGDWVYVESIGLKRVKDTMHHRHKNHIDIWVKTLKEEQEFHRKYKGRKLRVYLIKEITK
jgi:3D (Asp-Asp-Asp) domain-containing protein